jgi:hypothetical protein
MALRAIRLASGEIALELAWPQEVGGPLPKIDVDGTVESTAPYFSIWLYRPGSQAYGRPAARHSAGRSVQPLSGASGTPLPGIAGIRGG